MACRLIISVEVTQIGWLSSLSTRLDEQFYILTTFTSRDSHLHLLVTRAIFYVGIQRNVPKAVCVHHFTKLSKVKKCSKEDQI